jgi:hypothetical protein
LFKGGEFKGVSGYSRVKDLLGDFWILGVWGKGMGVLDIGYILYGCGKEFFMY